VPRAAALPGMAGVSFRFPSDAAGAFEPLPLAAPAAVRDVRAAVLQRREAAREALHGAAALAAAGWKLLLTDAASKTGARPAAHARTHPSWPAC
jgi:hypothetical protein